MNLQSGARLGPYEIVAPLGAGGMGEVYRAHDPRLDRTVAIKVLPAEFAEDARFRVRFEREAKAISALNHPHICGIYDVGQADGRDYLVMEYLEGETLADRLRKGALPLVEVLRYGIDIADALEKAHQKGIIHRDLKSSNIMITKSGAKLLDFGLAKWQQGSIWEQASSRFSQLETAEKPLTAEGALVGTLEYMAPEQLQGKEVDARTDIFALGNVLYRMATGKRPFEGESEASLIAAILEREPRPIPELQPLAPPALDRVVRACLAKDPDERIQTAHDVLLELRWISEEISRPISGERVPRHPRARWWGWAAGIAAAVLLIASAVVVRNMTMVDRTPFRAERFDLQPPEGVRVGESGGASILAISPDGEWAAFRGVSDEPNRTGLYLRSTKELSARLVGEGSHSPFFSPDSQWLGFAAGELLQKVPVRGGLPKRICDVPEGAVRGASWGDDGTILFSLQRGLLRVSADGGTPKTVTEPRGVERHRWAQLLPGSRAALFVIFRGDTASGREVAVISLEDRRIRRLASGTSPRYADGHLVYSHRGILHSAPFDLKRLELRGEAKPLLEDVYNASSSGFTAFEVSASGSLVYIPGAPDLSFRDSELMWSDREGNVRPVTDEKRPYHQTSLSPDAKRIVADIHHPTLEEEGDLWTFETDHARWTRLTFTHGWVGYPIWSPDGKWIIFSSWNTGLPRLFRVASDGSRPPETLTGAGHEAEYPGGISSRDNVLVFMRQTDEQHWNLFTLALDGSGKEEPFLATPALEAWPVFSPDGQWIAYESSETGSRQIHVRPYPGPGPRITVARDGGYKPFWSRDGRELFYRLGKEVWAVPVSTGETFKAGAPKQLFRADFLGGPWQTIDVAPDGRFLVARHPPESRPQRRLVYVPNWTEELAGRN